MNASIALTRNEDNTLTGSITIGGEVWTITNWRQGGDKLHILFDAEETSDKWREMIERQITQNPRR